MQYLIILRGSAGCGKSTWVKENDLEHYTLSPDALRVYVQSPDVDVFGNSFISQKNDHYVWDLLDQLLEKRMEKGELTVIDATHSRVGLVNRYKSLCDRYRYRAIVVEFPNDLETILTQNKNRPEWKQVPEEAIRNHVARINTEKSPNWTKVIKSTEWKDFIRIENIIYDFNQYESIWVFGDIHGCYEPLKNFFTEHPYNENDFYLFTGDYFDRGIQNVEVFEFLESIVEKRNVLLLRGNHEYHLWDYALDGKSKSREFNEVTLKQFLSAGITPSRMRKLYRKIGQMAFFSYGENIYFVSHGGIPCIPSIFVSTYNMAKGVGKHEDCEQVEESWSKNTPKNYYQIHGHRNVNDLPMFNESTRNINLCHTIESGGNLRIVKLSKE